MIEKFLTDLFWFIFKPFVGSVKEIKQEIRDTKKNLLFHARQISNPGMMAVNVVEEAETALRNNAANLTVLIEDVKCQKFLTFMSIIPSREKILSSSTELIGLSNSMDKNKHNYQYNVSDIWNAKKAEKITKLLTLNSNFCDRFSGWIVFALVMIGTVTTVDYLVRFTKYILGVF
jgi:hypothetical protein